MQEVAEKWDSEQSDLSAMCYKGLLEKTEQDTKGNPWRIPVCISKLKTKHKEGSSKHNESETEKGQSHECILDVVWVLCRGGNI